MSLWTSSTSAYVERYGFKESGSASIARTTARPGFAFDSSDAGSFAHAVSLRTSFGCGARFGEAHARLVARSSALTAGTRRSRRIEGLRVEVDGVARPYRPPDATATRAEA